MKNFITSSKGFYTLYSLWLLALSTLIMFFVASFYPPDNIAEWKNCIEQSNGTDIECGECDIMYNKSLKF